MRAHTWASPCGAKPKEIANAITAIFVAGVHGDIAGASQKAL
jgi:hypothetical protein